MALHVPLDRLQRWMQAVIVDPGLASAAPFAAGARAEVAPDRIAEVVLPSARLSAVERVGIYHDMYLLRMEEALATDYPGLKHRLGDRGFFDLVREYVQEYPSRHFSLNRLGDQLPQYVSRAPGLKRRAFCHDLARLEQAFAQVFDAPRTPAITAEAIAGVPADRWEGARLVPVAALALLAFRYPVGAYLDSVSDEAGHSHPPLRREDTWAVVFRRDDSVWRKDLSRSAHHLLRELAEGRTVGEAVTSAMRLRGRDRPTEHVLFRLFRDFSAAGLFQRIEA
jgi:Putative DNA-binding domain